jgi:hypothetical protein
MITESCPVTQPRLRSRHASPLCVRLLFSHEFYLSERYWVYTQTFNRHHAKVGHLFQGRFKAILVDRDAYLLQLCRYV